MQQDVQRLWRETVGDVEFDTLDPRATCRVAGETLAPVEAPVAVGVFEHVGATMHTLFPSAEGEPAQAPVIEAAYHVGAELGQGGMAVVHRAHQTRLGRDVALKMAHDTTRMATRRRFVAEAKVTGALDHPNIVPVHDLVETPDGRLALAMKLVEGEPWSRALQAGNRSLAEHVGVLIDVCNAVAFAHRRGFLHADLKPENVMLGDFGEVVVMDWGCAVSIGPLESGKRSITQRPEDIRRPFGTPAYMAPELALGNGPRIGPATDVYLLGAILFDVISGHPPHTRSTFTETLQAAVDCDPPTFPDGVPTSLAAICTRAMAREPEERFPTVLELRDALAHWLETRRSQLLVDDARTTLARCEAAAATDLVGTSRNALYIDLESALAGFRQARLLSPENADASVGEDTARRLVVDTALRFGDLGLAEAHAIRVPPERGRAELTSRIEAAREEQARASSAAQRVRYALGASLFAAFAVGAIGLVAVNAERQRAESAAALAEQQLAEITQLSDVQLVQRQVALDETLWPAVPARADALAAWLVEADALVARLPVHRAALDVLRAQGAQDARGWTFATPVAQWRHDTLAELVGGLEQLESGRIPDVRARLDFARTVKARSVDERRAEWDRAIAEVAASPLYHGLALSPQVGLVPLGADPVSGLQEFAHLATGEPPTRGSDGRLVPFLGMGVVLVLLPGGTFTMGASREPGPNRDLAAKTSEGPPHEVALAPFFVGKYELTQDQWLRATGVNPSAYQPGRDIGGHVSTALHPLEQVGWQSSFDAMARLALGLPTEAQWEYASRAGTSTVYWTGDSLESLQGAVNIADSWGKHHGGPESWLYEEALDDGYVSHAPIGTFRANAFGLHDTAGNVWEWCLDRTGPYTSPVRPGDGAREAPEDAPHLFRGGGFRASRAHARSADRYPLPSTDHKGFDIGLRAARPLEDTQ